METQQRLAECDRKEREKKRENRKEKKKVLVWYFENKTALYWRRCKKNKHKKKKGQK